MIRTASDIRAEVARKVDQELDAELVKICDVIHAEPKREFHTIDTRRMSEERALEIADELRILGYFVRIDLPESITVSVWQRP